MTDKRLDDPYTLLGVPTDASPREITTAYRRQVRAVHPDAPGGDPDLLGAVVAAYRLLHDPHQRARYDRHHTHRDATYHSDAPGNVRAGGGTPIPVRVHHTRPQPGRQPDLRAGPVRHYPA